MSPWVATSLTCVTAGSLSSRPMQEMFPSDVERQRIKLMDMIAALVG
jgi:hypothetical protein